MSIRVSRRILNFTIASVLLGSGSYSIGRSGIDVAQAITDGRCSSGAFTVHSTNPATATADTNLDAIVASGGVLSPTAGKTKLIGPNLIKNGGYEHLDSATKPSNWTTSHSGDSKFDYSLVAGHNSAVAARVELTTYNNRSDGDWLPATPNLVAGGYYQYSDYYRSNIATRATLMTEDATGKRSFTNLTNTPATTTWAAYSVNFFVPAGTVRVNIYHSVAAEGYLETDNVSLNQAQVVGFNRPLVSITFDDGWKSIYKNALPILERNNMVSTQYIISGYVGQAKDYVTPRDLYDFRAHGNEIASHTVDHLDLAREPAEMVDHELKVSAANLDKCYGNVTSFASPYGTYSKDSVAVAKKYYQTYRSTDAGYNTADSFDAYGLKVQNVDEHTTQAQLQGWLQAAADNHAWLILVYHQVDSSSSYSRLPADFERDLHTIEASKLTVSTVSGAYAEIKPQLE